MEKLKEQFSAKTISSLLLAAVCVFSMATLAGGSLAYADAQGHPEVQDPCGGFSALLSILDRPTFSDSTYLF